MGAYITTSFGLTHTVDFGGSGSPIVFVHGLGGSTTNWNAVAPSFTDSGHVLAIDLPGFGLSPPGRDFRLTTHREAIEAFLDLVGPATLIANSTGGLLSEIVASKRPDLVERLVLVSPATPPSLSDDRLDWPTVLRLAIQATPGLGEIYTRRFVRKHTPAEIVKLSMRMVTRNSGRVPLAIVEASEDMARTRKKLPWAGYASSRTATSIAVLYARKAEFAEMITAITAPTLIVQGTDDRIVSPTAVAWLASLRPDWELAHLDDTGHTPHLDAPLRLVATIRRWMARAESEALAG